MFNFDGDILENLGYAKIHMIDLNDFKKEVQKKYTDACKTARELKLYAKHPGRFDINESVKYAASLATIHDCEWIADQLDFELDVPEPESDETLIIIRNLIQKLHRDNEEELSTLKDKRDQRQWTLNRTNHEKLISRCEGIDFAYNIILSVLDGFIRCESKKKEE